jgi:hypothetical protein
MAEASGLGLVGASLSARRMLHSRLKTLWKPPRLPRAQHLQSTNWSASLSARGCSMLTVVLGPEATICVYLAMREFRPESTAYLHRNLMNARIVRVRVLRDQYHGHYVS